MNVPLLVGRTVRGQVYEQRFHCRDIRYGWTGHIALGSDEERRRTDRSARKETGQLLAGLVLTDADRERAVHKVSAFRMRSTGCIWFALLVCCALTPGVHAAPDAPVKVVLIGISSNAAPIGTDKPASPRHTDHAVLDDVERAVDFVVGDTRAFQVSRALAPAELKSDAKVLQSVALLDVMLADISYKDYQRRPLAPERSNYTIGDGLAGLQAHGATHGLLFRFEDPKLTARYSVADDIGNAVALTINFILYGGYVVPHATRALRMSVALVELETGRVVWAAAAFPSDLDLRVTTLAELVDGMLCHYPNSTRIGERWSSLLKACYRGVVIDRESNALAWRRY